MNSGIPNDSFYDGVAVLNLKSTESVNVYVWRFDKDGNDAGELLLGSVSSGGKMLKLLSTQCDSFVPGPSYYFQAQGTSGKESIQILGLTGAVDNAFFAPLRAINTR